MDSSHLTAKETWRYRQLFAAIILLFIIASFIEVNTFWSLTINLCFSLTVLLAIRTFPLANAFKRLMQILLMLAFTLNVIEESPALPNISMGLQILSDGLYALFLTLTVIFLSHRFIRITAVNGDVIIGSVSAYLLLGIIWFLFYQIALCFNNDAFRGAGELSASRLPLLYFSFTTLTTLGYGDVTPAAPATMGLANLEAIVGQLYPAILIARLVSIFSVEQEKEIEKT
jgi:hypothetical protein